MISSTWPIQMSPVGTVSKNGTISGDVHVTREAHLALVPFVSWGKILQNTKSREPQRNQCSRRKEKERRLTLWGSADRWARCAGIGNVDRSAADPIAVRAALTSLSGTTRLWIGPSAAARRDARTERRLVTRTAESGHATPGDVAARVCTRSLAVGSTSTRLAADRELTAGSIGGRGRRRIAVGVCRAIADGLVGLGRIASGALHSVASISTVWRERIGAAGIVKLIRILCRAARVLRRR